MLKAIVGVALLLAVALIGYRRTFTRLRLPIGARLVFLTGTEFILVGVALGGEFLGLLDDESLRNLTPLFSLGLGFIGLIFGIQLELEKILRFPKRYLLVAASQAVMTMAVVFLPCYLLMRRVLDVDHGVVLLSSLVLAATAGCTGLTTLALLSRELSLPNTRCLELLRYVSSLDALFGLTAVGFAFSLAQPSSPIGDIPGASLVWFMLSLGVGVAMGYLLNVLTRVRCSQEELIIFVIGVVLLAGGAAQFFRVSPLFVCMVIGVTMANLPGARDRVFRVLARLEKQFYIVFLILAGAVWRIGSSWAWVFAALYVCLRILGKVAGGYLAAGLAGAGAAAPRSLGLGLVSQGGIAVAMVVSFHLVCSGAASGVVITSVLTAVLVNELISPGLIRVALARSEETES